MIIPAAWEGIPANRQVHLMARQFDAELNLATDEESIQADYRQAVREARRDRDLKLVVAHRAHRAAINEQQLNAVRYQLEAALETEEDN